MSKHTEKQSTFLYKGIKNGLIKVESSGNMCWDIDGFVNTSDGKEQIKKIRSFLPNSRLKKA